jgi:Protein of unknown function (DUF3168)
MIESAIYSVLSSADAVTTLAGTRIYPGVLPKNPTLPAVVYKFITSQGNPTMSTRGMTRARLQLESFGETFSDAVNLRAAIVQTLAGYTSAAFTAQVFNPIGNDGFYEDLLQYVALAEAYLWFAQ